MKKTSTKKLTLNKATITDLNKNEMVESRGGIVHTEGPACDTRRCEPLTTYCPTVHGDTVCLPHTANTRVCSPTTLSEIHNC